MKTIVRHFLIDTYCLYLVSNTAAGMVFGRGLVTLFLAGVGVTVVSVLAKPVINLLLLPINMVSFGLFRWVGSAVVLFMVTLLIKDFKVSYFTFTGLANKWFDVPYLHFEGVWAFIAFSFMLSLLTSFIYWLIK